MLNVVARRLVTVVKQRLAVLRRQVQHRHRPGNHVVDRIPQMPPAALPWRGVHGERAQILIVLGEFVTV